MSAMGRGLTAALLAASLAACTMASGSPAVILVPIPRTALSPTAGSIGSLARRRPPPRLIAVIPISRVSIAATKPLSCAVQGLATPARGR